MSQFESVLPKVIGESLDTVGDGPFVGIKGLSKLTGIAQATVYSDLCRAPWKLPPAYRLPGRRRLLWDRDEVIAWIKRFPALQSQMQELGFGVLCAPQRRGRPRKASKAVKAHGPEGVELHVQGRV